MKQISVYCLEITLLWRRVFGNGFFYGQNLEHLTRGNNTVLRSSNKNTLWDLYALYIRPFGIIFKKNKENILLLDNFCSKNFGLKSSERL